MTITKKITAGLALLLLAGAAAPGLAQERGDRGDRGGRSGGGGGWNRDGGQPAQPAQAAPVPPASAPPAASPPEARGWRRGDRVQDYSPRQNAVVPGGGGPHAAEPPRTGDNGRRGDPVRPGFEDHRGDRGDRRGDDRRGDDRRWNDGRRPDGRGDHRDWRPERRVWQSPQRYRGYAYRAPPGFYARAWAYGDILPRGWYGSDYRLLDYWRFDLPEPPPGYDWVRVGSDAMLVDSYSGRVVEVVRMLFW